MRIKFLHIIPAATCFSLCACASSVLSGYKHSGSSMACVEGPPIPVDPRFAALRPTPTANCSYSFEDATNRIARLLSEREALPTVETAEKAFDLPPMTTSYDSTRTATYRMILNGKGDWKIAVDVRESFFPLDKGPERFVPGPRPKRLADPRDADHLSIGVDVLNPYQAPEPPSCIRNSELIDALTKAGWKDITGVVPPPTDGGTRTPIFAYGNKLSSMSSLTCSTIVGTGEKRNRSVK